MREGLLCRRIPSVPLGGLAASSGLRQWKNALPTRSEQSTGKVYPKGGQKEEVWHPVVGEPGPGGMLLHESQNEALQVAQSSGPADQPSQRLKAQNKLSNLRTLVPTHLMFDPRFKGKPCWKKIQIPQAATVMTQRPVDPDATAAL